MPADSVLKKAPFRIPAAPDADRVCFTVSCPDDPDHISNFFTALASLGLWSNYRLADDRTAKSTADVWLQIFKDTEEGNCMDCDCLRETPDGIQKFHPDGHGGGTWEPYDPRTDGTVPGPWISPPVGQTGNCLSAANFMNQFKATIRAMTAGFQGGLIFASIVISVMDFLLVVFPPGDFLFDVVSGMVLAGIADGYEIWHAEFDEAAHADIYTKFECAISCAIGADGAVSAAQISDIKDRFASLLPGTLSTSEASTWRTITSFWLDQYGPNGLTKLGNRGGVSSADCSDCGCPWVSIFDFETSDYASIWTVDWGSWSAGNGYVSQYNPGGPGELTILQCAFTSTHLVFLEMEYDSSGGSGGSGYVVLRINGGTDWVPAIVTPVGSHLVMGGYSSGEATSIIMGPNSGNTYPAPNKIRKLKVKGDGVKPAGWP